MFTPPRYRNLEPKQLDMYLLLLTAVLQSLPPNALEPPSTSKDKSWVEEGDSDDGGIRVEVVSAFSVHLVPKLDAKTLRRLENLPSPTHISTLLGLYSNRDKAALFTFCSSICRAWPTRQGKLLATISGSTGGGFVRELYREHVRSSPLDGEVEASLTGVFNRCIVAVYSDVSVQLRRMQFIGRLCCSSLTSTSRHC